MPLARRSPLRSLTAALIYIYNSISGYVSAKFANTLIYLTRKGCRYNQHAECVVDRVIQLLGARFWVLILLGLPQDRTVLELSAAIVQVTIGCKALER